MKLPGRCQRELSLLLLEEEANTEVSESTRPNEIKELLVYATHTSPNYAARHELGHDKASLTSLGPGIAFAH